MTAKLFSGQNPPFILQIQLPLNLSSGNVLFYAPEIDKFKVELESAFFPRRAQSIAAGLNVDETMRSFIEGYSIHTQINTAYLEYSEIQGNESTEDPRRLPFYGEAELQYLLDEYTRFPSMDEIFVEYIKDAQVRKEDGVPKLYVNYHYANLYSQANFKDLGNPAMVMVDGIPVKDLDFVFSLDPLKVEKIEIVTRRFVAGKMRFAGIVNFTTYSGDFAGQELPQYVVRELYHGLQRAKEFGVLEYNLQQERPPRIPDYRKVLLWEPNASIDSEKGLLMDFFTSDDQGEYRIEVNGISESGVPLHSSSEFRVENMEQ